MPTLLSESVINFEFADLDTRIHLVRPSPRPPRRPGVHQSGILAPLARKLGYLGKDEKLEEEMPWRMALGVMWEEFAFSSILKESVWQPGELTEDEISVNADGVGQFDTYGEYVSGEGSLYKSETCLDETKHTEKKVCDGDTFLHDKSYWMWQHQVRGYCHCYGPRIGRWTVMFYRGDRRGSGPVCKQFVVRFSDKEVAQTWAMLKLNYDLATPELGQVA